MKIINFISFIALFFIISCQKEKVPVGQISESLWLEHKSAQMPILVEGNIASKTLILVLHGGPGGNAKIYNGGVPEMSDELEKRYGVAYWDQRLAGDTRGHYNKEDFTIALMKEDLDLVVDLLRHEYGTDLKIFLMGHSWGGYLGNAYLSTGDKQQKIQGWIDVAGAHNIEKLVYDGVDLMEEVANTQLQTTSEYSKDWQEVLDYASNFKEKVAAPNFKLDLGLTIEMNEKAGKFGKFAEDAGLVQERKFVGGEWNALFFHSANFLTGLSNSVQTASSNIWDNILEESLTEDLQKITIPSLILFGKYDFVVAPSLGEEMMANLGTPDADKSLVIFDQSGHSPMVSETEKFVGLVVSFVEQYR